MFLEIVRVGQNVQNGPLLVLRLRMRARKKIRDLGKRESNRWMKSGLLKGNYEKWVVLHILMSCLMR